MGVPVTSSERRDETGLGRDSVGMGTRKRRLRRLPLALLLGLMFALPFAAGSSADGPTIEAAGPGSNGYYWKPSSATVGPGGSVSFRNVSAVVPHGVTWTGGP